ncbi:MAG: YgeY family selenium metabolism-linked hydrolase [Sediminispirochaetaceae bacterium]
MTAMKFVNDELIALCRDLVRIPGLSGEEGAAAELVRGTMHELCFDEVLSDEYGNVIGKIRGTGRGPTVLFDGHMDTVGIGNPADWKHDPYGAEIENGRIYGRGASDMKGALAAMIYGVSRLVDKRPRGDVYVSASVFEELFEGAALKKILAEIAADYVIIGEASELDLKTGQKGRAEIKITAFGRSGHAAHPGDAVNAVYGMQAVIAALRNMDLPEDSHLGRGVMELTDIISAPYPGSSVIPSECTATYDRRLVTGETGGSVLSEIGALIADLEDEDPELRAEASIAAGNGECYTGAVFSAERFFPAWYFDQDRPFVTAALDALRAAGIDAALDTYGFCTNGSASAGELGIPTLGFGPSRENQAHVADEYIEIDQLVQAARGYAALAEALTEMR